MPTILQLRRGTTAENDAYTGSVGELTVDTDLNKLRLHDGSTAGGDTIGDGSGNIQIGVTGNNEIDTSSGNLTIDSAGGTVTVDDNLTVSGNLIVSGTTTTVDSTTIEVQNQLVFEGSTSDDFELTLTAGDPTADRTITLPDATDTLVGKATTDTLTNKTLGATTIAGHLTPDTNETYDLGSSSFKFRDIYLSGTSINLGDATITASGSSIVLPTGTAISGGSGAVVDLNSTQTLTNKTIDASSNTLSNIANTSLTNSTITLAGDSGSQAIDLGDTLTIEGTSNEIETSQSGDTLTIGLPDDVTIGGALTVTGNLTVNGTTTTVNSTNTTLDDNLLELNSGAASNANDSGFIIERGSTGDNAIFMWDESADKFTLGTTTATASSTGDISITAGTLVAATFEGDLTGTATAAEYSDVAERFAADTAYEPGTVVALGGAAEITAVNEEASDEVFGVISSLQQAAFKMNGGAGNDETHPYIAMTGRVNVKVIGTVNKGDRLISASVPGYAKAATKAECTAFNVIGRALTSKSEAGQGSVLAAVRVSH